MDRWPLNRRTMLKVTGGTAIAALAASTAGKAFAQEASPNVSPGAALVAGSGTLLIGKAQEAVGFDPAVVTASSSFDLIAVLYDSLVTFDDNGKPQPSLAESWAMPDDLTYIFKLRQGVTFHNGQPLTAADVKFSFDRIKDPATASPWASQFEPVASIEATDASTVTFKMNKPYGPFLATLSASLASVLPKTKTPIDFQTTAVGTGPFMWGTYTKDTETVLNANPTYWESGLPKLASLDYKILPEDSSRLAAVRTGEIQLTTLIDPISVEAAAKSDGVQTLTQDTTDYYLLGLNCAKAPFDNPKVRQALSLAIDRQAIIDAVFFGQGKVSGPIVPTLGDWAQPLDKVPNYTVDTDQAKALLAEAGQSSLSFKIVVGSLTADFQNIALVIQDQLKKIGVTADLDQVEWGTFIERWKAHDFESFVSYNGSGNDPDRALYPTFHTSGSTNVFGFTDPAVDKLLDEGRSTADAEARKATYQKIETAIAEQAPVIFINTRVASFALRDTVKGFAPSTSQTWETLKNTTVS
jgi:peptide/nickel transport system substrate-binding protein